MGILQSLLLPGLVAEPDPVRGVDVAADRAQHRGQVDDRRLHHRWAFVEVGAEEDFLEHRPDLQAAAGVGGDQPPARRFGGFIADEVAPQLVDEEARVVRVFDAESDRVFPVPVAALAENGLRPGVVTVGIFARHRAGVCLLGTPDGVLTLSYA